MGYEDVSLKTDPKQNKKALEDIRRVMGTLPSQQPELKTSFVRGVEGISVELIDHPMNPYKAMYVMATSCWGSKINKWSDTSPENRFLVVKAVLERQALPLALESSSFTFAVEGISRACFDQLARTRIGAVFSAKGMRDNNWKDCSIRIPTSLWPTTQEEVRGQYLGYKNPEDFTEEDLRILHKLSNFEAIKAAMTKSKKVYGDIVDSGTGSWQAARTVLPLYVVYGFSVAYNFSALLGVCSNRMKFCEMEDTVATAWLYREEVKKHFPLLASYLKPGCDSAHKCQYHKAYSMSELFGCLFKECGRNPCESYDGYAEFNETCTKREDLMEQLDLDIPGPQEWTVYNRIEDLDWRDKELFIEE